MNRARSIQVGLIALSCLTAICGKQGFSEELTVLAGGGHWRKHYAFMLPRLTVAAAAQEMDDDRI